jgi:hypothetical protein
MDTVMQSLKNSLILQANDAGAIGFEPMTTD